MWTRGAPARRAARASSRMEKMLEQMESDLEVGGLLGFSFFNEDGELEDDTL